MLYYLVDRSAWTLRRERLVARSVAVKLRYCDFTTRAISTSLPAGTDEQTVLFAAARDLLARLDFRRLAVRLVGVCVERLSAAGHRQMGLFDERTSQRRHRLSLAQDAIRRRFGFSSLVTGRAIELIGQYQQDANGFRLRTGCLTR
jgi:DNA polymerase-4